MIIYNIASGKSPAPTFIDRLREIAAGDGIEIQAVVIEDGPGCCNIGIMLSEPNENWATQLTMVLMPAKFEALESDPSIEAGQFEDRRTYKP